MSWKLSKKLGALGAGILGTEIVNHAIDYALYPGAIATLGVIRGGLLMFLVILVVNYLHIQIYRLVDVGDYIKRIDEMRGGVQTSSWGKFLKFCLNAGYWPTFLGLCFEDPAKAFVFVRGGKLRKWFNRADWGWFISANLIGGSFWSGFWGLGLILFKFLWHLVF